MKNLLRIFSILFTFCCATSLNAQLAPTDDVRNQNLGCTSNNYTILETFLSGSATDSSIPVANCSPGDVVTAYVWVKYESNSNATVHAFTIFADLQLNHQD